MVLLQDVARPLTLDDIKNAVDVLKDNQVPTTPCPSCGRACVVVPVGSTYDKPCNTCWWEQLTRGS
jgi:hypothetical protein